MDLRSALIVGVGSGLSASLARLFAKNGLQVALASRNPDRLAALAHETAAATFACEAAEPEEVGGLFDAVIATQGVPDVVVYNASARARGPIAELDPEAVARAHRGQRLWRLPGRPAGGAPHAAARRRRDPVHRRVGQREGLSAVGGVRDGQVRAARPGAEHGARAGAAGHPRRALRHRRRHPQSAAGTEPPDKPDSMLDPDAIAESYWHVAAAAAQRLDLGGGTAALGRAVLSRALDRRTHRAGLDLRHRADGGGVRDRAAAFPRSVRGVHRGRRTLSRRTGRHADVARLRGDCVPPRSRFTRCSWCLPCWRCGAACASAACWWA